MKYQKLLFPLLPIIYLALSFSGCGLGKVKDSVDNAVSVIDEGITTIDQDSTKWQATIQEISDKLPKDIQSTIRNEMDQLVARSIARGGVEFRCNTDFLGQRATLGLKRIKALLLKQQPEPIKPSFCQVSPEALILNAPNSSRQTILIAGYDMDQVDNSGQPLRVLLFSDKNGAKVNLDEGRIGRTTHYLIALNVAGADFEKLLRDKKISKIKISWGDSSAGLPEVLVVPREAQTMTKPNVVFGPVTYTPPKTGGDADFNSKPDHPMEYKVKGESKIDGSKIMVHVYMMGAESQSDWTKVEGWGPWQTAYTAPPGWKIKSVRPIGISETTGSTASHSKILAHLSQGEAVNKFEIFGDTEGNDAGIYTRVTAYFTPVTIELEEVVQ
ncbi:MAG TPA: hypothetical protein VE732_03745 [Nitrososphaera sp.]|nr:hypothetical protein [Nitrososphaera sp.]